MVPDLLLSIHQEHIDNIASGRKNYEFRNYKPKKAFGKVWVYTTTPTGAITHVMRVDRIIRYPKKISSEGIGNKVFNQGNKTTFAYHIDTFTELKDQISLETMRGFDIYPPQQLRYIKKNTAFYRQLNRVDET